MQEENESILTYGSIHYYNQILKDLQQDIERSKNIERSNTEMLKNDNAV